MIDGEPDFAGRLEAVTERIEDACTRSGRAPADVVVVAVSKKFGPESVREAAEAGVTALGENRVQEARQKIPMCPSGLAWHMIGHLQTNKVRLAASLFEMLHGIDSLHLLQAVDAECALHGKVMPVCLLVNVSGEGSKFGIAPDDMAEVLEAGCSLINVSVMGLMTMAPFSPEADNSRRFFCRLRELRDELAEAFGVPLPELSMGMSQDFEVAVEEGATMLRLGSVLFGPRVRKKKLG